jgi:type II secretory pathway pseudopilin PulG
MVMKKMVLRGGDSFGQGTVEYLVIVVVIVVFGLLVASLVSGFFDSRTRVSSQKISNLTGEISIKEAVADSQGDLLVVVTNQGSEPLTLTKISSGTMGGDYSKELSFSQEGVFFFDTNEQVCVCQTGMDKTECTINFSYTTSNGLKKSVSKTITVECVNDSNSSKEITNFYHCADYEKDWDFGAFEANRVLGLFRAGGYKISETHISGYTADANHLGNHNGVPLCEDLDKDWVLTEADANRVFNLTLCSTAYRYNNTTSTWKCA